jgi:hypothetical protein
MEPLVVGQEVRPQGRKGTFRIIRIDLRQGVADLEYTTGTRYVEKNIPFEAIRNMHDDRASHLPPIEEDTRVLVGSNPEFAGEDA